VNHQIFLETPVGNLQIRGTEHVITAVVWPQQQDPGNKSELSPGTETPALLAEAAKQLTAYFAGDLHYFDLPLAAEGTEFQHRVWQQLSAIPFGNTTSYGAIAQALGAPKAARAVGTAIGRNPLAIMVPCHRVIGRNGALTGFAGGVDVKRRLLDLERQQNTPARF